MSDSAPAPSKPAGPGLSAASELLPLVYDELRKLAAHKLANEAAGQTLQANAMAQQASLRTSPSPFLASRRLAKEKNLPTGMAGRENCLS